MSIKQWNSYNGNVSVKQFLVLFFEIIRYYFLCVNQNFVNCVSFAKTLLIPRKLWFQANLWVMLNKHVIEETGSHGGLPIPSSWKTEQNNGKVSASI